MGGEWRNRPGFLHFPAVLALRSVSARTVMLLARAWARLPGSVIPLAVSRASARVVSAASMSPIAPWAMPRRDREPAFAPASAICAAALPAEDRVRHGSFLDRIKTLTREIASKFKVKTPDGSGEMEIDLSKLTDKAPESDLLLLDQYCERLASDDKPAFLLFDEFQEIARAKTAAPLIAALRTSLDKRKSGLVAVFTGSSREGLRTMFSAREAPFFRFATPIDLPPLDDAFVDHQLAAFKATWKAKVKRDEALTTFQRFDRNPLFFKRWLTKIAFDPDMSGEHAIAEVQDDIAEEFGFGKRWLDLNDVQRVTARLLAEHVDRIYGKQGARRIKELTGRPAPKPSSIQSAIARLSRLGIADKWDDVWRLNDPLLEAWVKDRPETDF